MKSLAIIPARGGSKRIPRKNIRPFLGKPIIAYSIEAALASGLFAEVMVSTDDEEIAHVAQEYGANVPFLRSTGASDDFATTAQVLEEVLLKYKAQGKSFEAACCLYPTAPFVTAKLLQESYKKLQEGDFDTVFPVLQYSYPIWRSLKVEQGKAAMNWPEHLNSRSQDLPAAFHDAGQFYWFRVDTFLEDKKLFTGNSGVIELSELEAQDIDSVTDWKLAELKYKLLHNID
ncbi:pseudaminic acid cytidylyltransferase [Pontibacter chinhatensis]|uniref:N-acylneuraminate cytidylyltransferase n=1 Tax=Pontibacter chinhatensis TaxID=1436961 RepID=A0A1I2XG86_9BACT|nr:pseudaminic acid cytidylyltransferase [Pontibacter chinhatensis]SFH12503.1 N-acylneuraminate cytidylyltransferase [Pontibacter chinhatensis]